MVLIRTYYIMFNTIKNKAYILILNKLFSVKVLKNTKLIGIEWYWTLIFWYWMVLIIIHYITFNTIKNIAYLWILDELFSVKIEKHLYLPWKIRIMAKFKKLLWYWKHHTITLLIPQKM
jgi:hypothetical protein